MRSLDGVGVCSIRLGGGRDSGKVSLDIFLSKTFSISLVRGEVVG